MKYRVNNKDVEYTAGGDKTVGDDVVLLKKDIDLTAGTTWADEGFTIENLFSDELSEVFYKKTVSLLRTLWHKAGLNVSDDFNISSYHTIAASNDLHFSAIEFTKTINTSLFPVPIDVIETRVSSICKKELIAKNPFDNQSIFHFRVIRPQRPDHNPLHRDVWLKDYKDCINLYIPIAGSNENSSLVIVPQSHLWPESKIERTIGGAVVNDIKFNVPAVTDIKDRPEFIRPNPGMNQVLVFSPYLIHGGATNLNADLTRISIELRLWKK